MDMDDEDREGFLNRPVMELRAWHILAALGAGGLLLYLITKKETSAPGPQVPQIPPSAPPPAASPGTQGFAGYASLGEQTEPLYDGHPMVDEVRRYAQKGWTVFKVPNGQQNVMRNRERFDVYEVYAAPPGQPVPRGSEKVSP
jgi:hypothetical protein